MNNKNIKTYTVKFDIEIEEKGNLSKDSIIEKSISYHMSGDYKNSKKYYELFLNKGFSDPAIINNYGLICDEEGDIDKATKLYEKSIREYPNHPDAYSNLASILIDKFQYKKAILLTKKAIALKPNFAMAYNNLGTSLIRLGNIDEAEKYIRKSIKYNPNNAQSHFNLATISRHFGDLAKAEQAISIAIRIKKDFSDAYELLGVIMKEQGKIKEALDCTQNAIRIKPNKASYHIKMGFLLSSVSEINESEKAVKKAIDLDPQSEEAYCLLGVINHQKGNLVNELKSYEKALKINPNSSDIKSALIKCASLLSDFKSINKFLPELHSLGLDPQHIINPFMVAHLEDNPRNYQIRATNFYNSACKRPSSSIAYTKKDKINIGYFSADFRNHPIMHVMSRIFELHNTNKFKIFIYSFGQEDKYTERVKHTNCCYRKIQDLNDLEIVELARKDQLDIAIDLMAYTVNNRMPIFSYRMAPIQIQHLGSTTGSKEIDYLIADKYLIPDTFSQYYTEKIIYMPHSFMGFDNTKKVEKDKFTRQEMGLPKNSFVLAAFHGNYKITAKEINSWSRIMIKASNTVLWLSRPNIEAQKNLIRAFQENGIDKNRIIFTKIMNEYIDHLSRHSCADLFLDTFNFNGHSTSLDALWTDLPVVSLVGKSFFARVSASYLSKLGLTELIANTIDQYENIIFTLVSNPNKLKQIKKKIHRQKLFNPLFDSEKYTEDLECKFINLVQRLKSGKS